MEPISIGEQIAKLRRTAGLTQEELGKAAGVSTQAVSRWECGGTPDVALLPAIADKLGVSIDTLFGRGDSAPKNIVNLVAQWLCTYPETEIFEKLAWLIWQVSFSFYVSSAALPTHYPQHCKAQPELAEGLDILERTVRLSDSGMLLGVGSEELAFMVVCPEPAEGYARYLASNEEYRRLFSTLARPGALELLCFLYGEKSGYYTVPLVSKRLGLPAEQAQALLEALAEIDLLERIEVVLDDRSLPAYTGQADCGLVPFLYLARWVAQSKHRVYYTGVQHRKAPLFRVPKPQKEEPPHEAH